MKVLIATGNPVTLSYAQALLRDGDIHAVVFDQHTSSLDGPQGLITNRLCVIADDWDDAVALLRDAGLGDEIEL